MADLNRNAADLPTMIVGATTAGVATTPVGADSSGYLYVNAKVTQPPLDVTPATQSITVQDTASTSTTYFNNQVWVSGTPTAGSTASFALTSYETGMLEISGTWTGTLTCEISNDGGVNWVAHALHQIGAPTFSSSFTNNFTGSLNLAAKTNVRIRATAAITGTATVLFNFSNNPSSVYVANAVKVVDGSTSTSTTTLNVVPASTAASSSNTAVVVGLSPNSPLPAGTNALGGVSDIITTAISSGSITVSTTAVAARVSSANLTNRKMLMISPIANTVYLGSSSSVTTGTGIPIYPGQVVSFSFSANVTPYLIAGSSTTVNVFEGA